MIKPKNGITRLVLYAKDIESIMGCCNRSARRLIQKIKMASGKTMDQYVTIEDFCEITGIDEESVREILC